MTIRNVLSPLVPARVFSRLQQLKAEFAIRRFVPKLVQHTYGGHRLNVHLHDPMSEAWYDCDWRRPAEFDLLAVSRLKPGALVFDVGAHQCVMAMLLAKEVGPKGYVVAVEPTPFNVKIGDMNLRSNCIANVSIIESMLSSSNAGGVISFQLNAMATPGQRFGRKVQSVTLYDLITSFGVPAVIYLDIEGFEADVLSAADLLLDASIDWCVELHGDNVLHRFGATNAMLVDRYLTKGFHVFVITDEGHVLQPATSGSVPSGRCHIIAIKRSDAAISTGLMRH